MNTIFNEGDYKMCYFPLIIHEICMTDMLFENFKQVVEKEKENINVQLYDRGNPIQILVQNPSVVTYDKFKLLIDNGADPGGGDCQDVFSLICDSEFNPNYIPILEYLFENNLFDESPFSIIENGEISNVSGVTDPLEDDIDTAMNKIYYDYTPGKTITQFPILLLAKHKEYLPILEKHKNKLKILYSVSDFISMIHD